jgi:hypothetical protein
MMTEIIPLNKTKDEAYIFDDLSIGDMFKLRDGIDTYIKMPDSIDINEVDNLHTEVGDVEHEMWNVFNFDGRGVEWMDRDTVVVPIRRVHLEYQMTV